MTVMAEQVLMNHVICVGFACAYVSHSQCSCFVQVVVDALVHYVRPVVLGDGRVCALVWVQLPVARCEYVVQPRSRRVSPALLHVVGVYIEFGIVRRWQAYGLPGVAG